MEHVINDTKIKKNGFNAVQTVRYSPKTCSMFNCVSSKSFFVKTLGMKAMTPLIKNTTVGKSELSFTRTNMQTAFADTKQKVCRI